MKLFSVALLSLALCVYGYKLPRYPPVYMAQGLCGCFRVYQPVCGENGLTYLNSCSAGCLRVEIESFGPCEEEDQDDLDDLDEQPHQGEAYLADYNSDYEYYDQAIHECLCNEPYAPVCGKDGVTYGNYCDIHCARVELDRFGRCEDPVTAVPSQLEDKDDPHQGGATDPDPHYNGCVCPAIFMPVCGEDGATYDNPCIAQCAGVEVDRYGECGDTVGGGEHPFYQGGDSASNSYGDSDEARGSHDCVCILIYKPVCGEDGITYGNACGARCAGVEIERKGRCEDQVGEDPDDDRPYQGGVPLPASSKEDSHEILNCVCDDFYAPLCGIDGVTYDNHCYAECAGVTSFTKLGQPCDTQEGEDLDSDEQGEGEGQ